MKWLWACLLTFSYLVGHAQSFFDTGYDYQNEAEILTATQWSGERIFATSTTTGLNGTWLLFSEIDTLGDVLWQKTIGQPGDNLELYATAKQDNGKYLCVGAGSQSGSTDIQKIALLFDCNVQDTVWMRVYGDTFFNANKDILKVSDGFIVAGFRGFTGNKQYVTLEKLDTLGNSEWIREYPSPVKDNCSRVVGTPDGGYMISGYRWNVGAEDRDLLIIKTDSNGNKQWDKTYGTGNMDYGSYIAPVPGGGYILSGAHTSQQTPIHYSGWIMKLKEDGSQEWEKKVKYDNHDSGSFWTGLLALPDTTFIAMGSVPLNADQAWLYKFDKDGNEIWSRTYTRDSGRHHYFYTLQELPNGHLLAGGSTGIALNSQDRWLVKMGADGCPSGSECWGVGIEEPGEPNPSPVTLWPNPVSETLYLSLPAAGAEVTVYDLSGHAVKSLESKGDPFVLPVAELPPGIYTVQVLESGSGTFATGKFVKE